MYKKIQPSKTTIKENKSYPGERIEEKVHRIVNNKEPIKDGAPMIYTERKHGVLPEYDPRTDRMDLALEKMTIVAKTHLAKREHSLGERAKQGQDKDKITETKNEVKDQSIQGTKPTE